MLLIITISILLFVIIISSVYTGHLINPITIFTLVWLVGITLNYLNWVPITPVDFDGWIAILSSTFIYILSAFIIVFASISRTTTESSHNIVNEQLVIKSIYRSMWLFSVISAVAIIYNWVHIIKHYGSIVLFFAKANLVYTNRIAGDTLPNIPYFGAFAYAAACLAGIYIEKTRNLKFVCLIPLTLVILESISAMGRTGILIGISLYLNPILINLKFRSNDTCNKSASKTPVIVLLSLLILIFFSTNLIRDARGGIERYNFPDNPAINFLQDIGLLRPSVYLYISGPIATFSNSLNIDPDSLGRGSIPGIQTFSPVFRLISYTGLIEKVSYYEEFVDIGSTYMNTGTYLKDIYIDYGYLGIAIAPCILASIVMITFYKWKESGNIVAFAALSFFYVYLEMSSIMNILRLGNYFIGFVVTIATLKIINRKYDKVF